MDKMMTVPCQLLVIWILVCAALDNVGAFRITTMFMDGDVIFTWNVNNTEGYNVSITLDNAGMYWKHVINSQYTVKNAWSYDKIEINVHRLGGQQVGTSTYTVQKLYSQTGQSMTLSWSAAFFPSAGVYTIYHTNKDNRSIIDVTSDGVTKMQKEKYEYLSRPYNSTYISFQIKNVRLEDAGYYAGGVTPDASLREGGIILIVNDKPSKPTIQGNLTIGVDSFLELHCSTQSHCAPEYYAKLVSLHFMWFLNNTKLTNEYNNTLRRYVSRGDRNSQYSCIVKKDNVESDQSDPVQINLLYGPDTLRISPSVNKNSKLSIKEGEAVGPYDCSADCNPPCDVTWQYRDLDRNVHAVKTSKNTSRLNLIVNRTIILFSCLGTYKSSVALEQNMSLNVQYLDETQAIANDRQDPGQIVLEENKTLQLSCYGNGNPNPTIRLSKHNGVIKTLETISDKWSNHTIERLQCSDSDTYKCTSTSAGFQNREKMIRVIVQCKIRLDTSFPIKTQYSAVVGEGVAIPVDVPVIANPAPLQSNVAWSGPTESIKVTSDIIRRDVDYKYNIRGSISIDNEQRIGNYTMMYNGEEIITIIIHAFKGKPRLDKSFPIKTTYTAVIGVPVDVPVIADPAPKRSNITWSGPVDSIHVLSTVSRKDVSNKYNIHAFILIENQHQFGNYTMEYNGKQIITVTIHANKECEDKRSDCHEFGAEMCQEPNKTWANAICAQYYRTVQECLYTPWADIISCTTGGDGFKVQVRAFSLVPKGTSLAKDCDKDLSRNKTCNINACPSPRGNVVDQPLPLPPVVVKVLSGSHTKVDPVDVVTGVVNAGTAALG